MTFKLDENTDARCKAILAAAGHDAHTVPEEWLKRSPDPKIWQAARDEARTLISQDMDFSNIILRGPDTSFPIQQILIRTLIGHLATESPPGRLWIVEAGRVRVREG